MIKKIILSVIIIGVLVGLFLFGRYQVRLYRAVDFQGQMIKVMDGFLIQSFPDQVKSFNESLK